MWRIISIIGALVALGVAGGCGGPELPPEPASPSAVALTELVFAYGHGGKNILDTAKGTFTKDMIADPPLTVGLRLTEAELERIAKKMAEIGFLAYPEVFEPRGERLYYAVGMHATYLISAFFGTTRKTVRWNVEYTTADPDEARLGELTRLIIGFIEAKAEYGRLPEPRGPTNELRLKRLRPDLEPPPTPAAPPPQAGRARSSGPDAVARPASRASVEASLK